MLRNVQATHPKGGAMKDERMTILKNQITVEEIMRNILPYPEKEAKPFKVMTLAGDYFFKTKEEAQAFATARSGFVIYPQKGSSQPTKDYKFNKRRS